MAIPSIKKGLVTVAEAKQAIKEVQQMSKPTQATVSKDVVLSVAQILKKQLTKFVFTKKQIYLMAKRLDADWNDIVYVNNGKKEVVGPGIIVFKERATGKLAVCSTVSLPLFFSKFNYGNVTKGKYGTGPKSMGLGIEHIYYEEHNTTSTARNAADKLRTKIKKEGLLK